MTQPVDRQSEGASFRAMFLNLLVRKNVIYTAQVFAAALILSIVLALLTGGDFPVMICWFCLSLLLDLLYFAFYINNRTKREPINLGYFNGLSITQEEMSYRTVGDHLIPWSFLKSSKYAIVRTIISLLILVSTFIFGFAVDYYILGTL